MSNNDFFFRDAGKNGRGEMVRLPRFGRVIGALVLSVLLVVALFGSFTTVGTGNRGVVRHYGKLTGEVLGEGLHMKLPFVTDVVEMSVRVQKNEIKTGSSSRDMQQVDTHVVINWQIDEKQVGNIYQAVGGNVAIVGNILEPAVNEVFKAASAKKNAEEIISKRVELTDDVVGMLRDRVGKYGITVRDVSLVDVQFSPEFNKAVEAKQVSEQQAKQAEYVAQKATADAKAAVNKAKGEAEAKLAIATAEAEANRLKQKTLTPELIQYEMVMRWNGEPSLINGGASPLLNVDLKNLMHRKSEQ